MKHFIHISVILSVVAFAGCPAKDSEMRKVVGKVTYQGAPVEEAMVQFVPLDDSGLSATGQSDAEGNYTLTSPISEVPGSGTKPAKYKVLVSKLEKPPLDPLTASFEAGEITYQEYKSQQQSLVTPPAKYLLPMRYSTVSQTPLEFTVEDKKLNEFNIDLTD